MYKDPEAIFDRAEVEAFISAYFDAIAQCNPKEPEKTEALLDPFLAEDYICREGDWPHIRTKAAWKKYWHTFAPNYVSKFYYSEPDGHMIIDCRNGIVMAHVRQEQTHIVSGEIVRAYLYNMHFRVKKVDDQLKLDREAWVRVPPRYGVDQLKVGEPGQTCWLFMDYSQPN